MLAARFEAGGGEGGEGGGDGAKYGFGLYILLSIYLVCLVPQNMDSVCTYYYYYIVCLVPQNMDSVCTYYHYYIVYLACVVPRKWQRYIDCRSLVEFMYQGRRISQILAPDVCVCGS